MLQISCVVNFHWCCSPLLIGRTPNNPNCNFVCITGKVMAKTACKYKDIFTLIQLYLLLLHSIYTFHNIPNWQTLWQCQIWSDISGQIVMYQERWCLVLINHHPTCFLLLLSIKHLSFAHWVQSHHLTMLTVKIFSSSVGTS